MFFNQLSKNCTDLHPTIACVLFFFQIPRSNTTTAGVVNMPGDGNQRPFRLGCPGETGQMTRESWKTSMNHCMESSQFVSQNRMAQQKEKASSKRGP